MHFLQEIAFFYAIYCVFHKKAVPLRQITEQISAKLLNKLAPNY